MLSIQPYRYSPCYAKDVSFGYDGGLPHDLQVSARPIHSEAGRVSRTFIGGLTAALAIAAALIAVFGPQ